MSSTIAGVRTRIMPREPVIVQQQFCRVTVQHFKTYIWVLRLSHRCQVAHPLWSVVAGLLRRAALLSGRQKWWLRGVFPRFL